MNEQDARAAVFQVGLCNTALAAILAFKFIGELGTIAPILNMIFNLSIGAFIANRFSRSKWNSKESDHHAKTSEVLPAKVSK